MTKLERDYFYDQIDLGCLDTIGGDCAEYGECIRFALRSSSVYAVLQMHDANGAVAFDDCDPMTWAERVERWSPRARASLRVAA